MHARRSQTRSAPSVPSTLHRAAGSLLTAIVLLSLGGLSDASAAQARVKIVNGNLVTAGGSELRAAPFFMSVFNTKHMRDNEAIYRNYFRSVSRDYGMNAVRICPWIGRWEYDIKGNTNHNTEYLYLIDKCVQWAEEDNIVAVVNLHTQFGTVLTRAQVDSFWSVVAPRYQDMTHVVFEAVNEPDVASAKSQMAGIYSDLRSRAPNTHLIMWSMADVGVTSNDFALQDLKNASGISYSNASFGFHVYDWQLNDTRRWERAKSYRDAGYPVVCTEMMSFQDADHIPIYYPYLVENIRHARQYGMSWMQWAPRFNYASIDQYGTNHLQNSDIGFFQIYKDELAKVGINFWSGTSNLNGTYEIKCTWGAYALASPGTTAWPTALVMKNPANDTKQRWELSQVSGNLYRVRCTAANDLYLHGTNTAWSNVTIAPLNTGWTSQQWLLEQVSGNDYRIKCTWGGNYLHGANTVDSAVRVAPLNTGRTSQIWTLTRK